MIYSMSTSTHADAPRGMEFLYSAIRLECRDFTREMHLHHGRIAASFRGGMPNAAPDAVC